MTRVVKGQSVRRAIRGGSDMHWIGGWNGCIIKASPWVQEMGVELLLM
jgi:hypothetical protein